MATNLDPTDAKTYDRLKQIRARTDLKIRPIRFLRDRFVGEDQVERDFNVRYYQIQGILHLIAMRRFVLGDDTGLGKCVTGDTLLLTDRGLLPIQSLAPRPLEKLEPGKFYSEALPERKVWTGRRWSTVKQFYYDGLRATKRITTRSGLVIEGSLRHPLLVRSKRGEEWVRTPNLREGDSLCVCRGVTWPSLQGVPEIPFAETFHPNANQYTIPTHLTSDLSRLLGYIVAEGHCPTRYQVNVSQHDPEPHADIRRLFKEVFGWEGNEGDQTRGKNIGVSSIQIRSFLESCGIGPELSADKRVPPLVLQAPFEIAREFLRGYFEGEGHAIEGTGVEVSSASERLLREVQILLLRFGIVSVRKPKRVKGRKHIYWRLTFFGDAARVFHKTIGFISTRKVKALESVLDRASNPNHDVVPHAIGMVEALRVEIYARAGRHGYRGGGISRRWGSAFYNTLGHIRRGTRNPTFPFLRRMLEVARQAEVPEDHPAYLGVLAVVSRGYSYDPIIKIEDGFAEVMDIEVDDPDHCFVGNGVVNHNTIEAIVALSYLWEKTPNMKVVIFTVKSTVSQWAAEFDRFTQGVNVFVNMGTPDKRIKVREAFVKAEGPSVCIMGYRTGVQDFAGDLQRWKNFVFVLDEVSIIKNPTTQVHKTVAHMAEKADRVWGLTATLIENHLLEGWAIYQVVAPGLFTGSKTGFMKRFCITRMQSIGRGGRQIPIIVGYHEVGVKEFRETMDPFYFGRAKWEVAEELPALTTRVIRVGMTKEQRAKYDEALEGLLLVGARDDEEREAFEGDVGEVETTKLTALIYCQEIVDHLALIGWDGPSDKLDTLLDMITEGDLSEQKVIIYTRFERMVTVLMEAIKDKKIEAVRITGKESEKVREKNKMAFQNPTSGVNVIVINDAAARGVNLQAAKAIVFYDTPWSAGIYLQILGRMIRIGSAHDRVYALHMAAKDSIDERVLNVVGSKMDLIEEIIGKRLKGEETLPKMRLEGLSALNELFAELVEDAKKRRAA